MKALSKPHGPRDSGSRRPSLATAAKDVSCSLISYVVVGEPHSRVRLVWPLAPAVSERDRLVEDIAVPWLE